MSPHSYTVFEGGRRLVTGALEVVALAVAQAVRLEPRALVLAFDDRTGEQVGFDTRGTDADVLARLAAHPEARGPEVRVPPEAGTAQASTAARGRGRPRLGVVAREVTLLPRHWAWLAEQPGGASVALRRLVDEARRVHVDADRLRRAHERAYRFMSAMAGDFAGFEEAARALFAGERPRFEDCIAAWPQDIREYAVRLAFDATGSSTASRDSSA